jgi:hypothetical protein
MAYVEFKYNYQFGSSYRYYRGGSIRSAQNTGLSAFVVNHLNQTRQRLVLDMSNARRRGEGLVRARSRVDTGSMKRQVTGTGDFGTDILKITFGWEELAPYYAPFQEFGTQNGITAMKAVLNGYTQVVAELQARLK